MNNFTFIEFALVGLIILLQFFQALKTFKRIGFLKSIIPDKEFFTIELFNIPIEDLQVFQPKDILANLSSYKLDSQENFGKSLEYTYDNLDSLTISQIKAKVYADHTIVINATRKSEIISEAIEIHKSYTNYVKSNEQNSNENQISLINPNETCNDVFYELLKSINVYLLRNKGATTDFNLIKDITERNIDTEDEDISQRITTPLYLGLMGTMLGIIFGLFDLFLVSDNGEQFEIKGFLIGVSIAMSASLIGLLFTVLNSKYYKDARKDVEKAKNDFYTFIQTELLPILNQSVSSSIYMLHTNLVKFNDNFTVNINRLTGLLNKNYDAVIAQDNILQSLEKLDIAEFAKANIKVLMELKSGTEDLHKFNQYLSSLNLTVDSTTRLSNSFQTLLNKVNNFEGLSEKLDSRIDESNKLVQFLNDHYEVMSDRSELINDSVKKVDDVLNKSLVELREHTKEKIEAIKELTIKEEDLITKTTFKKMKSLEEISLLEKNLISKAFEEKIKSLESFSDKEKNLMEKAYSANGNYLSKLSLLENLNNSLDQIKTILQEQKQLLKSNTSKIKMLEEQNIDVTSSEKNKIIKTTAKKEVKKQDHRIEKKDKKDNFLQENSRFSRFLNFIFGNKDE